MDVGLLKVGDAADFIEVNNLKDFTVKATWIEGRKVAENGKSFIDSVAIETVNKFRISPIELTDLTVSGTGKELNVIEVLDGELVTNKIQGKALLKNGLLTSNVEDDILKMVVVNRYEKAPPAIAFIKNFGLQKGAIAGSVAHDSHNVIAVGVDDEDILKAINGIIENKGGLSISDDQGVETIALPVAGLMSDQPAEVVSKQYEVLSERAIGLGSKLRAPYMSLSFMALLVIPSLKLSDKGLFDGDKFEFVPLEN